MFEASGAVQIFMLWNYGNVTLQGSFRVAVIKEFVCLGSTFSRHAQYFWSIRLKIAKTYWNSEGKCLVHMSFLKEVSRKKVCFWVSKFGFRRNLQEKLRFWAASFIFEGSLAKEVSQKSFDFELQSLIFEGGLAEKLRHPLNFKPIEPHIQWTSLRPIAAVRSSVWLKSLSLRPEPEAEVVEALGRLGLAVGCCPLGGWRGSGRLIPPLPLAFPCPAGALTSPGHGMKGWSSVGAGTWWNLLSGPSRQLAGRVRTTGCTCAGTRISFLGPFFASKILQRCPQTLLGCPRDFLFPNDAQEKFETQTTIFSLALWLAADLQCLNLGHRFGPCLEHTQLLCTNLIPTVELQGPWKRYRSTRAPLPLCDSYPLRGPWYLTLLCPSYVKQVSALFWLRRFALSLEPWLASVWNITVKTLRTNMTIV